ncbi:NAD(P)-dependent oxidoreductase [Pseudonocardia sp. RS010]|uniref:NAD(P)-dependent oxidoreductase n=1 Tax=Pseudonocardia sp. RS010 TaxID=3385979 RepID=UPI00399F59A9
MTAIGFVGLGTMGRPMACRLLAAGHRLVVFDIDAAAVAALVDLGAEPAASAAAVGEAVETVLTSLPTPAIVREAVLGGTGIAAGSRVRRIVELSTTGTAHARTLAAELAERGIATVDAPVSGGKSGAAKGTLAVMVACAEAELAAVEPVLAELGRVFRVGEAPGQGQAMKLLNNYLSATALAATAEAFVFGAKAGLDPAAMVEVVNAGSGRNSATQDKFPRAVLTGSFDFGFTAGLMTKDVVLFAEQADELGVPLFVGSAVRQLWQFVRDREGAGADFTAVVRPLEEFAGVQVRG